MRLGAIQVLANIPLSGCSMMVVLLAFSLGATPGQAGLIMMAYGALALVSNYAGGVVADRKGRWPVVAAGLGASSVAFFALVLARSPSDLLVLWGLAGMAHGLYPAALVALGHSRGEALGPFISRSSLGWALGYTLAWPLSQAAGSEVLGAARLVFLLSGGCYAGAFLLALGLPRTAEPRLRVPFFSTAILRKNWSVYFPFLLRHTGAQAVWIVFTPFLFIPADRGGLGVPLGFIGPIHALNLFTQALVMRRIQRWRDDLLIPAGFMLTVASFLGYALVPSWPLLLPLQVTVAVAWSALYVGSVSTLLKRNEETATATGIMSSLVSLAHIPGPLAGGFLAEQFGFRGAFVFAAGMALAGYLLERAGSRMAADAPGPGPGKA
ncbi:MAG: MFS transporter [Halobacteria archaeon]